MSALTRWVLAHKRIVVVSWIVLYDRRHHGRRAGNGCARPGVLGPQQGGLGDQRRRSPSTTTAPAATRCRWFRWSRCPRARRWTRPECARTSRGSTEAWSERASGRPPRLVRVHRRPDLRLRRRPHRPSRSSTRSPTPTRCSARTRAPRRPPARALADATVGGAPVHLTGFDALVEDSGADNEGPGVLIEALIGGVGALLVLTFVFASFLAVVPIDDGDRVDHDHLPAAARC